MRRAVERQRSFHRRLDRAGELRRRLPRRVVCGEPAVGHVGAAASRRPDRGRESAKSVADPAGRRRGEPGAVHNSGIDLRPAGNRRSNRLGRLRLSLDVTPPGLGEAWPNYRFVSAAANSIRSPARTSHPGRRRRPADRLSDRRLQRSGCCRGTGRRRRPGRVLGVGRRQRDPPASPLAIAPTNCRGLACQAPGVSTYFTRQRRRRRPARRV